MSDAVDLRQSKRASIVFATFGQDGKHGTFINADLLPEPIEMELAGLHDLTQYRIDIVDRDIGLVLTVAVVNQRATDKMHQIGLIAGELADFGHGVWLIFEIALNRLLDKSLGRCRTQTGEMIVARHIEEDRPVATRQLFNLVSTGKQEIHKLA